MCVSLDDTTIEAAYKSEEKANVECQKLKDEKHLYHYYDVVKVKLHA